MSTHRVEPTNCLQSRKVHVSNGTLRPRTGTTEHNVDDGGHLTGSKRFAAFTVRPESYQLSSARWPQVSLQPT